MRGGKRPRLQSPSRVDTEDSEDESDLDSEEVDRKAPLAGRIEALHMENFMCHTNLEVVFNKRVTFVTGKNGSGKSTIMAALIVVLGGSANTTGRGAGIADLIKKGASWARVTITLRNVGTNTYKRDIYGNKIIITRAFTRTNAGTYVCKAENGAIISRKKEEVDKIATLLDLQYKNPVCILSQDTARSFLSTGDSHTRFKMLMDATHLQDIKDYYAESLKMLHEAQKQIGVKIGIIDETKKEIDYLQEKLDYFASLEKYKKERQTLEYEYVWSLVTEEEKMLQEAVDGKADLEQKIREYTEEESQMEGSINNLMQKITEVLAQISNAGSGYTVDKEKKKELEVEIRNFQQQIEALDVHLNQMLATSRRQIGEINTIKEHLENNRELTSQSQIQRGKITERLKQLRTDLSELHDRIETTQRDSDNAVETRVQYSMALENLKPDLFELERSKKILQVQAERLVNAGKNAYLKYGPFTMKLREMIEEAYKRNQFQRKPVGPCGLYVTLSGDNKWARAVENLVGPLMNTYCCDNKKDFQVLTRIMERTCGGKNPPVIISRFKNSRYRTARENVSATGFTYVVDVLHFSNDVVYNTFVDQSKIESTLLFETDAEAARLMSHIRKVPKNVTMGMTLKGDQYYPAPNYRTYYGDNKRALKYFDTPAMAKAAKDTLDGEIQKADMSIKEKHLEAADLKDKLTKLTFFLKKTECNLRSLKQNQRRIEAEIKQLKDEEESCPILPTRVVLLEELEILEKSQAEVEKKINEEKQNEELLMMKKAEKEGELGKIVEIEQKVSKEVSDLNNKVEEYRNKVTTEKTKKGNLGNKIKDAKLQLNKLTDSINEKKRAVAIKTREAVEVHTNRVETDRSPKEVKKLLEKCKNYLRAAEKNVSQKEAVLAEYNMKSKRYTEAKESSEFLKSVVAELTATLLERGNKLQMLYSHMANLVSFHFQACLQTRGYTGHLNLDYDTQNLHVHMIANDGTVRSDTKTLSGGEKSYSTVSLILAIWRAVNMPFYFLDEFDVFMDKVNRKVILDLLMDHAMDEERMQFIFITPQDVSSIQPSDSVEIYRMPDPRN